MSLGEDRVRVSFSPSSYTEVDKIKQLTAALIDECQKLKQFWREAEDPANVGEVNRLVSLAQTAYEEAAMWAVKAATFNK